MIFFDYSNQNIGKPTGIDIKEKKLTLPLIYTLAHCEKNLRKKIIYIIKNENRNSEKVKFVIDAVKNAGGIHYATDKMLTFRDDALKLLYEFKTSETRDALEDLVRYTTDREY